VAASTAFDEEKDREKTMNRIAFFLTALAMALSLAGPAIAEDCGPLQLINSLVLMPDRQRVLVPVTINNQPEKMVFNTAGGVTSINQRTVDALKLDTMNTRVRFLDGGGNASEKYVAVDFKMGDLDNKDIQFMVTPNPQAGELNDTAGVVATDIMSHYDVELDLSAGKVNLFSQKHCDGHVIYWHPTAVAVMPITLEKPRPVTLQGRLRPIARRSIHIWVPITLDGKPFTAAINTSSARSTMSAAVAKYIFGVTPDSPGAVKLEPINGGEGPQPFGYVFKSLTFDTVTVTDPHIVITPDLIGSKDPNNTIDTDSRVHRQDEDLGSQVTIGMDVLTKLRTYIAFGERKLYMTPATPVADVSTTPGN
jgi:Aspartyl protease